MLQYFNDTYANIYCTLFYCGIKIVFVKVFSSLFFPGQAKPSVSNRTDDLVTPQKSKKSKKAMMMTFSSDEEEEEDEEGEDNISVWLTSALVSAVVRKEGFEFGWNVWNLLL